MAVVVAAVVVAGLLFVAVAVEAQVVVRRVVRGHWVVQQTVQLAPASVAHPLLLLPSRLLCVSDGAGSGRGRGRSAPHCNSESCALTRCGYVRACRTG